APPPARAGPGGGHLRRGRDWPALSPVPRGAEGLDSLAAAEEAGPVAGGKRGRLVEEEELGPAPPRHRHAVQVLVAQFADQPAFEAPALFEQRASLGIMDDAPIAGEHSARRGRDDLA